MKEREKGRQELTLALIELFYRSSRNILLISPPLFYLFIFSGVIEANSVEHSVDLHNALIPVSATNTVNCNSSSITNTNSSNNTQALSNGGSSSGRSTPNNASDTAPGKLFVGGLSWQTSSEKLREYFGMFGTVTDVLIMKDPITQVCRLSSFYKT
jgi:RNA recognition motif-containing protein